MTEAREPDLFPVKPEIAAKAHVNAAKYREMVERERVARGLSRRPQGDTPEEIEAKLRKAEERVGRLRRDLEGYGR